MSKFYKRIIFYKTLKRYSVQRANIKHERNKLFPGRVRWIDLCNARYISRKPIYDFLLTNTNYLFGSVLDFGCGSMEYRKLLTSATEYYGLDVENAQANGFYAEDVTYYDGVHIPFEDEKFDSILAIEVFEHVEYLDDVLREIHRVIKKGGYMIFTVPMNFPSHLEPWDFRRFTKYGIKEQFEKNGFTILEIRGSTTLKNTIRRLRILEDSNLFGKVGKIFKCLINNIGFALSNNVKENEKSPIDWLVLCRKERV